MNTENPNVLGRGPQAETSVGASAKVGKPELLNRWMLSVDDPGVTTPGGPVKEGPPPSVSFYLQVVTRNIGEKSPRVFGRRRGNKPS